MDPILHRDHVDVLRHHLHPDTLIAVDYDGTLAPIVENPDDAHMRPQTCRLLRQVAAVYRVALISGRARQDLLQFVGDIRLTAIVGNHGSEGLRDAPRGLIERVAGWRQRLQSALAGLEGIDVEDKEYSLAVHYRRRRHVGDVQRARAVLDTLADARIIGGKHVWNVVARDVPNKGDVVRHLCDELAATTCVFVGDDETDEDVFALADTRRLLGIRVGHSRMSAARYYVGEQTDVDDLFRVMLAARSA